MIRKATMQNIDAVAQIYDAVHDAEESGALCTGWDRSVYPVRQTALAALAREDEVMVLHTLVVDPQAKGRGYGSRFVDFYESYALEHGCRYLRMDTNERNASARALYRNLGYREVSIVPCAFNGIPGVQLVCLEKTL